MKELELIDRVRKATDELEKGEISITDLESLLKELQETIDLNEDAINQLEKRIEALKKVNKQKK